MDGRHHPPEHWVASQYVRHTQPAELFNVNQPGAESMPIKRIPSTDFAEISAAWDTMNDAHYGHPLLEARFTETALAHIGNRSESIFVLGDFNQPDAIFVMEPSRLGTWSTFQASQSPLGAAIIRPDAALESLGSALFRELPLTCQALSVTQQDPDILPRPTHSAVLDTLDYIPTARITLEGTFDDYWAARGKNLRHNIKRQRNRLEREGIPLRLEVLTRPEEMEMGVREYGELESRGWKAEHGTAVHPENAQGRFYTSLLEQYAATGDASIYRYFYGDDLVAIDLCISGPKAFIILKTTYDESIEGSSPALLMRREYFPSLFVEHKAERIEFYGRVMDWHTKWSDEIRNLYHANIYRSPFVARVHARLQRATQRRG